MSILSGSPNKKLLKTPPVSPPKHVTLDIDSEAGTVPERDADAAVGSNQGSRFDLPQSFLKRLRRSNKVV